MKPHIALSVIGLCLAIAAPAFAVQGRAYVERERLIVKMTKQMVKEAREADGFRDLIRELDSLDLEESTRGFWRTAHAVKDAMAEEVRQGHERLRKEGVGVQNAGVSDTVRLGAINGADSGLPLEQRVDRMKMIMLETVGLRNPLTMNDASVIARYRHLVGEFHSLLQTEVDEIQAEIDALKEQQRATNN